VTLADVSGATASMWLWAPKKKKPEVDVSEHLDETTFVLWLFLALVVAFFALRPELWRRLWFKRVDPRPAGLLRIAFGTAILWTFIDLAMIAEILFTDEGLYTTELARQKYGARLRTLWDPELGFQKWSDIFDALWSKFTVLHLRSDPPFVYALYGTMLVTNLLMIVGFWTRTMTFITWLLAAQIYNYTPIFLTGGDTALRVMFFLALFLRWGEAYSIDSIRRRRKAVEAGASGVPALRMIPGWPQTIMMVQLVCIYFATGLLKSGPTWFDGSALYYALNLDHFYRFQAQEVFTFLHWSGISRLGTWITHYWERLFPLALIGVMLRSYERDRAAGTWPHAGVARRVASWLAVAGMLVIFVYVAGIGTKYFYNAKRVGIAVDNDTAAVGVMFIAAAVPIVVWLGYRTLRSQSPRAHRLLLEWILGKRLWLTLGLLFHAGIDLGMNVGTFVQVMMAPYFAWLGAREVDALWRWVGTRPARAGEAGRPERTSVLAAPDRAWMWVAYPLMIVARSFQRLDDRLKHRIARPALTLHHAPDDEPTVRRLAMLRTFDLGGRLRFVADDEVSPGRVVGRDEAGRALEGKGLAARLVHAFPALWAIYPVRLLPGAVFRLVRLPVR
jgi:hypothetical protein